MVGVELFVSVDICKLCVFSHCAYLPLMHLVCVCIVPTAANTIELLKQVIHMSPRNRLHMGLKGQRLSWGVTGLTFILFIILQQNNNFLSDS